MFMIVGVKVFEYFHPKSFHQKIKIIPFGPYKMVELDGADPRVMFVNGRHQLRLVISYLPRLSFNFIFYFELFLNLIFFFHIVLTYRSNKNNVPRSL